MFKGKVFFIFAGLFLVIGGISLFGYYGIKNNPRILSNFNFIQQEYADPAEQLIANLKRVVRADFSKTTENGFLWYTGPITLADFTQESTQTTQSKVFSLQQPYVGKATSVSHSIKTLDQIKSFLRKQDFSLDQNNLIALGDVEREGYVKEGFVCILEKVPDLSETSEATESLGGTSEPYTPQEFDYILWVKCAITD